MSSGTVVVVGMGEIGSPLSRILRRSYPTLGVDVRPEVPPERCSVLHICYPYQIEDFVRTTAEYVAKYRPELTIINSTVVVGTTRNVCEVTGTAVVYSPVRGKHAVMEQDMLRYKKFIAGASEATTTAAAEHLKGAGFRTARFSSPETAELSKLLETTWLGVLVGWTQEMERLARQHDSEFSELNQFMKEIDYVPSHIFPGVIGGHCVLPNIELLKRTHASAFLDAVETSNLYKIERSKALEVKVA